MNICMIPVRKGSERLAKKNYLKINRFTVLEIALIIHFLKNYSQTPLLIRSKLDLIRFRFNSIISIDSISILF